MWIVVKRYLSSGRDESYTTYAVRSKEEAIYLGESILRAYVKTHIEEDGEEIEEDLEHYGSFDGEGQYTKEYWLYDGDACKVVLSPFLEVKPKGIMMKYDEYGAYWVANTEVVKEE